MWMIGSSWRRRRSIRVDRRRVDVGDRGWAVAHTATRTGLRNGSRPRLLSTPAGDLELAIPKLRTGSFFPSLLERRRRMDQALFG
jgi:Transposase, Mutator family